MHVLLKSAFSLSYKHASKSPVSLQVYQQVVTEVHCYSQFVPWCTSSTWLDPTRAELEIAFMGTRSKYVSAVTVQSKEGFAKVTSVAQPGRLFKHLNSEWLLQQEVGGTAVNYQVQFKFAQMYLDSLSSVFMGAVGAQLVKAFQQQAAQLQQVVPDQPPLKEVGKQTSLLNLTQQRIWQMLLCQLDNPSLLKREEQVRKMILDFKRVDSSFEKLVHQVRNRALYW